MRNKLSGCRLKKRTALAEEEGSISLEACVTVLSFLLLMLLLSSMFVMFMAQNVTAHVALQTSQSLSLEVYKIENLTGGVSEDPSLGGYLGRFITNLFGSSDDNPAFVEEDKWYEGDEDEIAQTIRTRFVGYLTGGDEDEADEFLKNMNVVNGLNGLDFSGSFVSNGTLYIILKYELEYYFDVWNVANVSVEQRTSSKLWK